MYSNEYGQQIGAPLPDWTPRALPEKKIFHGQSCDLEPLSADLHGRDLFDAFSAAPDGRDWTWLSIGPFAEFSDLYEVLNTIEHSDTNLHFAIIDLSTQKAIGTIALIQPDTLNGKVEMGYVLYSRLLRKTKIATEAQFLLMQYVFDELQYRRYEWKCDHFNTASKQAALRLGFSYEGTFRKLIVYKGRSRDTDWFSLIDDEWPNNKLVLQTWLAPHNFDHQHQQIQSIQDIRKQINAHQS